jgi:hypothetical protein
MNSEQLEKIYEIAQKYNIDVSGIVVRRYGKFLRAYCDFESRVTAIGGKFRHSFKINEAGEVFCKKIKRIGI